MSKYRNRIEIIADILSIVRDGARKTQIMYKGNLSYKLLTRYLIEVIGSGLVYLGENAETYRLTEKGKAFLRHFESYARSCTEAEQHMNNMKSLKAMLEEMCLFKRQDRNKGSDNDSEFFASNPANG